MNNNEIKDFLDSKVIEYNNPEFIKTDPISIPHKFSKKEDIEISAFIAATIAWGQRSAILKSGEKILNWLHYEPYNFIMTGDVDELPEGSVYRTFNHIDLKYFLGALKNIYTNHGGLEKVFTTGYNKNKDIKEAISYFRKIFVSYAEPERSGKHIANVDKGSSAKRINMFLRWMVRNDAMNVDFGLWNDINSADLMLPLDVHSGNTARKLGILTRKQSDWKAVEEVTAKLREFEPQDPIKYDYALFGLGVFEKF